MPELPAGEAAYLRAWQALEAGTPGPSIGEVERLYALEATTDPLRAIAAERLGDLADAMAARVSAPASPPPELVARLRSASPEARAEVERDYARRVAAALAPEAHADFCRAHEYYRRAVALDASRARASAQLEAYGAAFAASCDAATVPQ